jgi:hypothetical protein
MAELRKIPDAQLEEIFKEHMVWLNTKGIQGERADLHGVYLFLIDL